MEAMKEIRPEGRWVFARDGSGHDYLIPADKTAEFSAWVEHTEDWDAKDDWAGEGFDGYRLDRHPSCYAFVGSVVEAP